jgi:hypothetical protein
LKALTGAGFAKMGGKILSLGGLEVKILVSKTLRAFLQAVYYCFRLDLDNDLPFEILAQGQRSHWAVDFF